MAIEFTYTNFSGFGICEDYPKTCMSMGVFAVLLLLGILAVQIILPWMAKKAIEGKDKETAYKYIIAILVLSVLSLIQSVLREDEDGNRKSDWLGIIVSAAVITLSSVAFNILKTSENYETPEQLMTAVFGINLATSIISVIFLVISAVVMVQVMM